MCQSRILTVHWKFVKKKSKKSVFGESLSGTVLFKSKLTFHCESRLSTQFSISIENQEEVIENQIKERALRDNKQKIHPWLISW